MASVDIGCTLPLVTDNVCSQLSLPQAELPTTETMTMLRGTMLSTLGAVALEVGGTTTDVLVHHVYHLPSPILLGY